MAKKWSRRWDSIYDNVPDVYIVKGLEGASEGLYKIGMSVDVSRRVQRLRRTYGPLQLIMVLNEVGFAGEHALHEYFADKMVTVKGCHEWFRLNEEDFYMIRDRYNHTEKVVEISDGLSKESAVPFSSPNSTMDDKLDELYFCLPIAYGKQRVFTDLFGVSRTTLLNWLCKLRDEGLAEYVGSRWVKCYNWAEREQC